MIRRLLCDIFLWSVKTDEIDGIGIADFGRQEHEFTRHMRAALAVIREIDPRRFNRVQRLRWIANSSHYRGAGWGQYIHIARLSSIDFVRYEELSDDQLACVYAALIVHEATHCLLAQRGCRYEGEARRRHERICVREENRFCRLLEAQRPGSAAWLIREFDPSQWAKAWSMSKLDFLKATWQRAEDRYAT